MKKRQSPKDVSIRSQPPDDRPRRFAGPVTVKQKLALLAVSSLIGLLLCEGLARVLHLAPQVERINPGLKESPYRLSDNPFLGYVYKENYRGSADLSLPLPVPYVNAMGFQDRERSYEKRKGSQRIIMLGDSVVACGLPQVLEEMFSRDHDVEVLNFGVNGYCTRAEVEMLKERGLKFDPDLVIVVFVDNDYLNINQDLGWAAQELPALVKVAFLHSHLFRAVSLRLNWYDLRLRMGVNDIAGKFVGLLPVDRKSVKTVKQSASAGNQLLRRHLNALGDDNVTEGLKMLKALSEKHGFRVMIAIWPSFIRDEIVDCETVEVGQRLPIAEDQILHIEKLAATNGFPCIRLSPFFRKAARLAEGKRRAQDQTIENYYTRDGVHPWPIGNQVAAAALKEFICRRPDLLKLETRPKP